MPNKLPRALACAEIEIVPGLKLRVHVLDNGERIIEAESMRLFLDWLTEGEGELTDEIAFRLAKAIKGS